jgi:RNA polymerase sigma-70 factor (ECF subfamily)
MEQPSDETLMAAVMAGDGAALATLVEHHHSPLLGYLYRLVGGDRPLAEDLCQETFLRLLQQPQYQPSRPFKPWLYTIATNLARDHFKSATVSRTLRQAGQEERLLTLHDPMSGPKERALAAEQGREVAAAFAQLGEEYRAALLRFYQGLSLREIADALHIPLGTVKSRLSVGTHRLRELLAPIKEGEDER